MRLNPVSALLSWTLWPKSTSERGAGSPVSRATAVFPDPYVCRLMTWLCMGSRETPGLRKATYWVWMWESLWTDTSRTRPSLWRWVGRVHRGPESLRSLRAHGGLDG